MVAGGRLELPSSAYEAVLEPSPVYPAINFGPGSWIRTSDRSIIGAVLCHLSFSWNGAFWRG